MLKKTRFYIFLIGLYIFSLNISFSQTIYPTDISGLAGWYSSDSILSSNGSSITNWNDLSSNNNDLIQSSIVNQGIYITNQLNNKPCVRFDGINSFYSFLDSVDFRTVIIVGKVNESVFSDYRGLLGGPQSSSSIGGYLINGIGGSTAFGQGGSTSIFSRILKNNISALPSADFNPINNYWVGSFEFTTNRKQPSDLGRIDNGNQAGRYWSGDIFEIIIYKKTLSSLESDNIFNYLYQKYAPPVILPPDILVSNSFCDTVIMTNRSFESYVWSTGATTSSISVNRTGKYWVNATNIFGKVSSDTILVSYPGTFLSNDSFLCSSDSIVWNTMLPKDQYSFLWQNNSTDSLVTIKQSGNYYVKVTDSFGCSITSDTIKITEDHFSNIASLGPDLSLCAGNSIALTSGAVPSLTYTWSTGSNDSSILVNTSGQYSVVVTNTNNCVAKDTINVTILGQAPVADFSSNTGCINSLVSFTNLSAPVGSGTITAYSWNFGDISSSSNTSTLINPSHTYTNTGTYTISLNVITDASCQQTITKIIQIFPKPSVNFSSGLSCQNDNTLFFNSSSSVSGYSITSYNWNFGDPGPANTSTVTSPTHTFTNSANYTIKLVATNNVGCKDSLISIIAVKPQVKADFTYSSPCVNTSTLFHDNSIAPLPASQFTRTWNFSVGTNTPVGLTVSKTFTSSGVYSVTLTVAGNSGTNLCSSKITKLITIFEPPTADFTVPSFCAKDTVTATNLSSAQSGVISSYDWKLLNISNTSSVQNPTLTAAAAGTYSVRLTVTNSFTCKDSVTKPVTVFGLPNIDFTTNPVAYYYINSPVSFVPTYTAVNSYFWNIVGITTSTVQSPSVVFNTQGTYTIFLNSQDLNGCRNSKTKTLQVLKRYLDLAILNVNTARDNDGFITVKADIANYGSVQVSTFDIHYRISDAGNIKETWNGTFNPNSIYQYTFVAKSVSQKDNTNNITCVEIEKVNGVTDENTTNNDLCNTLNTDDISVSNPIPNPAEGDVTLPVILNRDMEYTISIYNSMGQIVYEETTEKGITGLNFVTLPTASYAKGCYIIKTKINDKLFIKKFIKITHQ